MAPMGGLAELKTIKFWTAVMAELLGTLLLVALGYGSAMYGAQLVQIALAVGICVATVMWCFVSVSGGHINPAITATLLFARKISVARGIAYIVGQMIGAVLGAAFLQHISPPNITISTAQPFPGMTGFQAMSIEALITFILVLTFFATSDVRRKGVHGSGPLAIGLSVTLGYFFAVSS